ncbi:terminase large subunit [Mongoliimonas terrestris]|uniref:terminase large subunit n=1 Tax=Mongoliimonas terrestris TaxID=1709001 RepID=UPI0009498466|nr:terminase large subunit [Mongoliimonas terrestris]
MRWSTACPDWQARIVEGRSLVPFDPLFPEEADAALAVFKSLRVVDVPGMPTFGECCEPWVFDFVAAIFGAYDAGTAKRRISDFLLLISKKNAKSTIAAGIMVTALIRNWRHSNELLLLAPTMEVANNSFNPAAGMVKADEELRDLLHVQTHLRTITHRVTGATLKIVAADSDTVSGKKAGFVLVDELWLFGKKPNAAAMLQEATGGLVSRPEGFVVYLTTHSDEPPSGVWKTKLDYFRDVRDGVILDPNSLGVLYEWPEAMLESEAYLDPSNFYVTNPNIGRSVSQDWLERKLREAINGNSEGEDRQTFLAKHLNVPIGQRLRRDRWPGVDYWDVQAEAGLGLDELLDSSEVVTLGIDGGGLDDLLSLAVVGRQAQDSRRWRFWGRSWAHPSVLERRKSEAARLRDFEAAGDLVVVDRLGDDLDDLVALVQRINATGKLHSIGLDPASVGGIVDALAEIGVGSTSEADATGKARVVGVSQGWQLQGSVKTVERKLADGSLTHCGQALLSWAASNARTETRGNATMVTKAAAGSAKIDPVMAVFDAVALMSKNPEAIGASVYETRGILMV